MGGGGESEGRRWNSVCSPSLHDGYTQAVCVICDHFLCWAVLCNLEMTPLMVITVLCAAVAEESDLREQHLSHEQKTAMRGQVCGQTRLSFP